MDSGTYWLIGQGVVLFLVIAFMASHSTSKSKPK